jgi:hypothetical protein
LCEREISVAASGRVPKTRTGFGLRGGACGFGLRGDLEARERTGSVGVRGAAGVGGSGAGAVRACSSLSRMIW